jgi:Right handed beta helix region
MTWHRRKVVTGLAVGVMLPAVGCRGTTTTVRQRLLFSALRSGRQIMSAVPERIKTIGWDEASLHRQDTGAADYIRSESVTEAYAQANPLTSFRIRDANGAVHGYRLAMSVVTPQMLGVPGDGSGSVHPALLALAGTGLTMTFPSGTYLLDNRSLHQINDYTGTLRFASGARLLSRDADRTGLYFYGGAPRIEGLVLMTRRLSATRQLDAPMLYLNSCAGPVLTNVTVEGGAGAGIVLRQSHDASLSDIIVRDVLADGLDLFNCSRFTVSDVSTDHTGDDGVAVLDYRDGPRITGGMLRNIRVRNGDTRGITMVGPSGVTLDNFQIEDTRGSGLLIGEDAANGLRVPDACTAINGVIRRAGHRAVAGPYSGNRYGIEVACSDRVELRDIRIIDSATRGLSATSDRPGALLVTKRISVEGAEAEGIHVRNQTAWTFDAITASDTGGAGIYAGRIARLKGGLRTVIRAARSGVPNRAIWDEDNGDQSIAENRIVDDQDRPTGFIYFCQGAGRGSAGRFIWSIKKGPFYYDVKASGVIVAGQPRKAGPADLPVSDMVTLGPLDPETRRLTGVATRPVTIVLPRYGQFPGMVVTIMRSANSGPAIVRLIDGSRPGQTVATLPGDRAATQTIYWNAIASRWQASR